MLRKILFTAVLLSQTVALADLKVSRLSSSSDLAKKANAIGTRLGDDNISSGTTILYARKVTGTVTTQSLKDLGLAMLKEDFKDRYDVNFPNVYVRQSVNSVNEGSVDSVAVAVAKSADWNESSLDGIAKKLWVVLNAMGVKETSKAKVVKSVSRIRNESDNRLRDVSSIVFVNPDTEEGVILFLVQGHM